MTDPKLRVFLCHSSQDKTIVRELYQRFNAESWIEPWLDEEKLLPGHEWKVEIEKVIEATDAVIVCLSNNSNSKEGYLQRELKSVLDIALEKHEGTNFIIPLRLEACEIPHKLRDLHYIDYFPSGQRDVAFQKTLESLRVRYYIGNVKIKNIKPEENFVFPENVIINNLDNINFVKISSGKYSKLKTAYFSKLNNIKTKNNSGFSETTYSFWISQYPITYKDLYLFFRSQNRAEYIRRINEQDYVKLKWGDIEQYFKWLNRHFKKYLPDGYAFRLPYEEEWEKALHHNIDNFYPEFHFQNETQEIEPVSYDIDKPFHNFLRSVVGFLFVDLMKNYLRDYLEWTASLENLSIWEKLFFLSRKVIRAGEFRLTTLVANNRVTQFFANLIELIVLIGNDFLPIFFESLFRRRTPIVNDSAFGLVINEYIPKLRFRIVIAPEYSGEN